jgi:hypothetical protein
MELQATRPIDQVDEGSLPVATSCRDPSCDPISRIRFRTRLQVGVALADMRDRHDPREAVRERLDALGAQPFQLRATVVVGFGGQRSIFVILSLR